MSNELTVHEPRSNTDRFDDLVRELPGARYIGHSWRDEPLHLVCVDTIEEPSIPAGIADTFGYVYQPFVHWDDWEVWHLTVLCVPELAAEILDHRWYLLDPEDTEWTHLPLGAEHHPHLAELSPLEAGHVTAAMLTTSTLTGRGALRVATDLADAYVAGCDARSISWRSGLELLPAEPWDHLDEVFDMLEVLWR